MIIASFVLLGFINLGTFHIKVGIDLPEKHFTGSLSILSYDVSIGPQTLAVPGHSRAAVEVAGKDVDHSEPPASGLDPWS